MKILLILVLLTSFFITACNNSDTTSSDGDIPLGELKGQIVLYDSLGKILSKASDVAVELEGTSFITTTDSSGIWSIKNLPSRTYSIVFTKPGFYTMKNMSFPFLGGGISYYGVTTLQEHFRFIGTLDGFVLPTDTETGNLFCDFSADAPDSILFDIYFYLSRTPAIDPGDYSSWSYEFARYTTLYQSTHSINQVLSRAVITTYFNPGDTVYAKMLFGFRVSHNQYLDVSTLKTIEVGLGMSNTLSAILP